MGKKLDENKMKKKEIIRLDKIFFFDNHGNLRKNNEIIFDLNKIIEKCGEEELFLLISNYGDKHFCYYVGQFDTNPKKNLFELDENRIKLMGIKKFIELNSPIITERFSEIWVGSRIGVEEVLLKDLQFYIGYPDFEKKLLKLSSNSKNGIYTFHWTSILPVYEIFDKKPGKFLQEKLTNLIESSEYFNLSDTCHGTISRYPDGEFYRNRGYEGHFIIDVAKKLVDLVDEDTTFDSLYTSKLNVKQFLQKYVKK